MFCNRAEPNKELLWKLDPGYGHHNLQDWWTHRYKQLDDNATNSAFPQQAESDMRNLQASDQKTENSENKSYNFIRTDMATNMINYYIQ